MTTNSVFSDSKPHYEILDGLRGVASLMVIVFHIFEIFSGGDHTKQIVNHGYLGVDFFFLLSGFVIAHAYDDRWKSMTLRQFVKRRLIRLQPMVVAGMVLGAICFYPSASTALFAPVGGTSLANLLLIFVLGSFLIPVPISMDIRGWTEMYPLNGPAWTLFFEYIANLFYAVFLRKTSTKVLSVLVFLAACLTFHFATTNPKGDVIGGWALNLEQLQVGFTRLLYPFLAGLLLARIFKPIKIKNAFLWCSLLLVAILAIPRVGDHTLAWQNGIYDASMIVFIFPLIVLMGASGEIKNDFMLQTCQFLGNISYPIYMLHFPLTYIFYAWVVNNNIPMNDAIPYGIFVLLVSIALAYACFKFYDLPLRKWLGSL